MKHAAELDAIVRRIVREEVRAALAVGGEPGWREYASAGPLPLGTSRRVLNREARAMIVAKIPGARREGRGLRDRCYFVEVDAWHAWRTTSRTERRVEEPSDADLAADALTSAGLRVVRGGRR